VAYTELDIRFTSLPPTAAGLSQQSTDYANTVGACLATTGCVGITVWDFTDKYSWIPSTFSGEGDACLWYANFTTHPAYTAVVNVLGGSATSTTSVVATTVTATKTTSTTPPATSTASSSGGTLAEWAQCDGINWQGSGTCVVGTTCTYSNAYYSQCLP
jgi:endo-1,4-beta-xylanase